MLPSLGVTMLYHHRRHFCLLSKVMDRQTCLIETLAKGLLCRNGGPPRGFPQAEAPITIKDWLCEMEKKLDLITCSDEECVGVTAH
jgi:hypothetical protein